MQEADIVSVTALVIAVFALFVSLSQLLQQYFATAEGYRRCREDVIGEWSAKNATLFDLRNLRFETVFTTPYISLDHPANREGGKLPIGHRDLPGDLVKSRGLQSAKTSWLALLRHLRLYQEALFREAIVHRSYGSVNSSEKAAEEGRQVSSGLNDRFDELESYGDEAMNLLSVPMAIPFPISWDFMPPEVLKPFAIVSLHDLLVLGHRLRFDWTEVNPLQGRLTAQDAYGNSITAYSVHGLGLMVNFREDPGRSISKFVAGPNQDRLNGLMIPTLNADKLAFDVIPGDSRLGLDDLASAEDYAIFKGSDKQTGWTEYKISQKVANGRLDQLMPLISPCLLLPNCTTTRVRRPSRRADDGILNEEVGFVVFRERIKELCESNAISQRRRETLDFIRTKWSEIVQHCGDFESVLFRRSENKAKLSSRILEVHDCCTLKLESWICEFQNMVDKAMSIVEDSYVPPQDRRPVHDLVRIHLVRSFEKSDHPKRVMKRTSQAARTSYTTMHRYIDEVDDLSKKFVLDAMNIPAADALRMNHSEMFEDLTDSVGNAWFILIFRALVFNRSVDFVGHGFNFIPAKWLYSKIEVHIT